MDKNNISLEARKALNEFKLEVSEELNTTKLNNKEFNSKEEYNIELNNQELKTTNKHVYNLKENLTPSDAVTKQLIETDARSRKNPNNSFSDFLGKYF